MERNWGIWTGSKRYELKVKNVDEKLGIHPGSKGHGQEV